MPLRSSPSDYCVAARTLRHLPTTGAAVPPTCAPPPPPPASWRFSLLAPPASVPRDVKAPEKVTVNEFSTVASVWTNAQFLSGTTLQGYAMGLRIAAGNVPNFVDLSSGKFGRRDSSAVQQYTNANNGQLRHDCIPVSRMHHSSEG